MAASGRPVRVRYSSARVLATYPPHSMQWMDSTSQLRSGRRPPAAVMGKGETNLHRPLVHG